MFEHEPQLTAATLVRLIVSDLLHQKKFAYSHFPEVVDLAVVTTGLGMLQCNINFVEKGGAFWDPTHWMNFPRPFLDQRALAYVSAIAAWVRGQSNPDWTVGLSTDLRRSMLKSLRYLNKTGDSFFQSATAGSKILSQSQPEWLALANDGSPSSQIIAIRHLEDDPRLSDETEKLLLANLNSRQAHLVLHSIATVERLKLTSNEIVEQLSFLVAQGNDEVRAKALLTLSLFKMIDEETMEGASKLLASRVKHVEFAAIYSLATLPQVPVSVLLRANQGLIRALQICNYELIGYYMNGFNHWIDEPATYLRELLQDDSPEYLEITLEALANVRNQLVEIK